MSQDALARAHARRPQLRLRRRPPPGKGSRSSPNQFVPMATLVEALHANNKDDEAKEAYRKLEPMLRRTPTRTPRSPEGWPRSSTAGSRSAKWTPSPDRATDETIAASRVDLEPLGPLAWSPWPAEPFTLNGYERQALPSWPSTRDGTWSSCSTSAASAPTACSNSRNSASRFKAFEEAGTDVVAIGTDTLEDAKALKSNADGIKFPMPFLPDPTLEVFKKYQAFDDFEDTPASTEPS